MKLLIKFFVVAAAMLIASELITGITVDQFWPTAIIAAVVLGVLNITVRPILLLLTLPINLLTLGLFTFVLNAIVFWLLGFIDGVEISGFLPALLGSLTITLVKWLVDLIFS